MRIFVALFGEFVRNAKRKLFGRAFMEQRWYRVPYNVALCCLTLQEFLRETHFLDVDDRLFSDIDKFPIPESSEGEIVEIGTVQFSQQYERNFGSIMVKVALGATRLTAAQPYELMFLVSYCPDLQEKQTMIALGHKWTIDGEEYVLGVERYGKVKLYPYHTNWTEDIIFVVTRAVVKEGP